MDYLDRLTDKRKRGELSRREFLALATGVVGSAAASTLLAACGGAAESTATGAPAISPTVTPVPPTPTPKGPSVGGTFVYGVTEEAETLDPHKGMTAAMWHPLGFLGGALATLNPDNQIVPYLAESWTASPDGLTYEFKLRKGVKFHDGAPCTAQDWAWTFTRATDPEIKSPTASALLSQMIKAEAVDDYTLRLTYDAPYAWTMAQLTNDNWLQPLQKAAVEKAGDTYGRQPVGIGPFKFKEWVTGERIVFERNPDFNWGPPSTHQGPPYIETLEFRTVPEYATILAGLEAGEITYAQVQAKDVQRLKDTGEVTLVEWYMPGNRPSIFMNVTKPPLDDVRVRKALNMAIDREAMIKLIAQGNGKVMYGPLSDNVIGYNPNVKNIGYRYDLAQAKALMEEAGYTPGPDGMLQKDGEPLNLEIETISTREEYAQVALVAQEQLKQLGVTTDIAQYETAAYFAHLMDGGCTLCVAGGGSGISDLLNIFFQIDMAGGGPNYGQVKDPELDELLQACIVTVDPQQRQEIDNQIQERIVEQAYMIPLYSAPYFSAVSNRVKGVKILSEGKLQLYDAYFEST